MTLQAHPVPLDGASALRVIRSEFTEMPGMHLSLAQAVRLWAMAPAACKQALDLLVRSGFLIFDARDGYSRADTGSRPRRQPGAWRTDA